MDSPLKLTTMTPGYFVVRECFPGANKLREAFDKHFANPSGSSGPDYQVWDYWHIPSLYTYLRTNPESVLPANVVQQFRSWLSRWALDTLGLTLVTPPYLSLYVNGCKQELHNDSGNGRWGYVYSLTRWEGRSFLGGETMILREDEYWVTGRFKLPAAGRGLYDVIPARFNQLVVFDDRLIHAVPRIEGSMNPLEARVVLHGHILDGGPHIDGPLSVDVVRPLLCDWLSPLQARLREMEQPLHGYFSMRILVTGSGHVAQTSVLSARLLRTNQGELDPGVLVMAALDHMSKMRFPAAVSNSTITVLVAVGD
jgi:hypothetical protein